MKHRILIFVFILCLLPGFGQDLAPDTPEIIIPDTLLIIETPELLNPELGIPLDESLLEAVGEVMLPRIDDFPVQEPRVLQKIPGTDITFPPAERETSLTAESVLGAGTRNHIMSRILLYKLGDHPTMELDFLHEALDGFSLHPPGSSFYSRTEELTGELALSTEDLEMDADGSYREFERGLQGQSEYDAQIYRNVRAALTGTFQGDEIYRLRVEPEFRVASLIWKGVDPERFSELLASGSIVGELFFEKVRLGLSGSYGYRTLLEHPAGDWDYTLHRIDTRLSLGITLPRDLRIDASGGWYYSADVGHLFPFSFGFGGTPFNFLTFSLSGGYRARGVDMADLLERFPVMSPPEELRDDHGWFGKLDGRFNLSGGSFIRTGIVVGWNSGFPRAGGFDSESGFFDVLQEELITVEPEAEITWQVSSRTALNLGWQGLFYSGSSLMPQNRFFFEVGGDFRKRSAEAADDDAAAGDPAAGVRPPGESSRLGGGLSLLFLSGPHKEPQLPELGLSGFYRITDSIKLGVEAQDLLAPFMGGVPRWLWEPYEEPGIRFTAKVHIRL